MSSMEDKFIIIINFIATGLIKWYRSIEKNGSLYPYPDELRTGLNRLASFCISNGVSFPQNISEAVELFQKPICSWGIPELQCFGENEVLLVEGFPTDTCYDLASSSNDIEAEITEQLIMKVMNLCISVGKPQDYVNFRRKLIENPVISKKDLISWSLDKSNCCASHLIKDAYEEIPVSTLNRGKTYTCGYCGWTIEWRNNIPRCDNSICAEMTDNFKNVHVLDSPYNHLRLKRGLQRFVSKPGMYEIILERKLQKLGLKADMWPNFDAYDLRISFPNGAVWAVDVKDRSNPYLLARNVSEFSREPVWDKAYYVIPDYRKRHCKDFKKIFYNEYCGSKLISLEMESDFIKKVKRELERKKSDERHITVEEKID